MRFYPSRLTHSLNLSAAVPSHLTSIILDIIKPNYLRFLLLRCDIHIHARERLVRVTSTNWCIMRKSILMYCIQEREREINRRRCGIYTVQFIVVKLIRGFRLWVFVAQTKTDSGKSSPFWAPSTLVLFRRILFFFNSFVSVWLSAWGNRQIYITSGSLSLSSVVPSNPRKPSHHFIHCKSK